MARHSLTVQVNPSLPGHVAVVVNEPSRQTYAGFGPEHHHRIYDKGQFDVHSVNSGATPPQDYSSVAGDGQYATFTIPISEAQARAANEEIQKSERSRFGTMAWISLAFRATRGYAPRWLTGSWKRPV